MAVEHPRDPREAQQDLGLVAMINEAHSDERLNGLVLIARGHRRGLRGHGVLDVGRRLSLRLLLPRRA